MHRSIPLQALECSENLSEISLTERSLEQDEKDDTVCVQEEIKPAKKSKAAKRRVCLQQRFTEFFFCKTSTCGSSDHQLIAFFRMMNILN